jgi:hypothetical protein
VVTLLPVSLLLEEEEEEEEEEEVLFVRPCSPSLSLASAAGSAGSAGSVILDSPHHLPCLCVGLRV